MLALFSLVSYIIDSTGY